MAKLVTRNSNMQKRKRSSFLKGRYSLKRKHWIRTLNVGGGKEKSGLLESNMFRIVP